MTKKTLHNKERARAAFLEAMSRVASTVSVVTTDGAAGRTGVTVSSLVSVSADNQIACSDLVGPHHAIFGEVKEISTGSRALPFIYANRADGTPAALSEHPTIKTA